MRTGDRVLLDRAAAMSYCICEREGEVIETSRSGHLTRVRFGNGRRWVGTSDLTVIAPLPVAA